MRGPSGSIQAHTADLGQAGCHIPVYIGCFQIRELLCGERGALSPEGAWMIGSGDLVSSQAWGRGKVEVGKGM